MKKRDLKINLIIMVIFIYSLLKMFSNISNTVNTIIWIVLLGFITILTFNSYNKLNNNYKKTGIIVLTLIIINILYLFSGFLFGFAYNSVNGNFLLNIFNFILLVIIQEYIRALLFNYSSNSKKYIIFVTFIFIMNEINIINIDNVNNFINIFVIYIPLIIKHVLLSYIAIKTGYHNSIIYRVINNIVIVFLPILPNLNWLMNGIYLIMTPVIMYIVLSYYIKKDENKLPLSEIKKENPLSYIPYFLVLSVLLIFISGGFSYKITAVMSNSMYPNILIGDSVIAKKAAKEEIKEGDIIQYIYDNKFYIHRVAKIVKIDDEYKYITKGDNNNDYDDDIKTYDDILGKVVFKIKYIGYPSVWLNKLLIK